MATIKYKPSMAHTRANVLVTKFGITFDQARSLKAGQNVETTGGTKPKTTTKTTTKKTVDNGSEGNDGH